ncbi:MAG: winged helix-turn-helix domain-containing protein [Woeseiaceae bacterium]|nr:winged helix-turn-helix domain-containing protein [Woeseiaceae bacterium]
MRGNTGGTRKPDDAMIFALGPFVLDVSRGTLLRDGHVQSLRPKSFEVLLVLVRHAGTLVSKNQLVDDVWHGGSVSDDSITQCIVEIRRLLDDRDKSIVKTVPRRGYVLDAHCVRRMRPDFSSPEQSPGFLPTSRARLFAGASVFAAILLLAMVWRYDAASRSQHDAVAEPGSLPDRIVLDRSEPASLDAYDAYLAGLYYLRAQENGEPIDSMAIEALRKSVDLDGRWAPSRAALGRALHFYASGSSVRDAADRRLSFEASRRQLLKAIEIDPDYGPAYGSLAYVLMAHDQDFAAADALFRRAESLSAPAYWARALFFRYTGELDKAIEQFELAIEQYPHARFLRWQAFDALLCAGRLSESRARFRSLGEAEPGEIPVHWPLAYIAARMGEMERAQSIIDDMSDEDRASVWMAPLLALLGLNAEAEARLQQLEADDDFHPLTHMRTTRALGDPRRSLSYLRGGAESSWKIRLVQCPEAAGELIDDPEFMQILVGVGIPVRGEIAVSMN